MLIPVSGGKKASGKTEEEEIAEITESIKVSKHSNPYSGCYRFTRA